MNSKGFTLIELVVVIVILGILAVTAVPKYINLKADAQTATLEGVKAAMQGASALVYGKSIVKGNHKIPVSESPTVEITEGVVSIGDGYPSNSLNDWKEKLLELDLTAFSVTKTFDGAIAVFPIENDTPLSFLQPCLTYYRPATSPSSKPLIGTNQCS
jgi:MSHA pilin protein MshA